MQPKTFQITFKNDNSYGGMAGTAAGLLALVGIDPGIEEQAVSPHLLVVDGI